MRTIALGLVVLLACPILGVAANDLAVIHGQVHDSTGAALVGALIVVAAASPVIPERIAFTDSRGSFAVVNLFAGEYSVKVTMPRFLPANKAGIRLNAGGSVILTVNLQNAMDIVRRATTRDAAQSADIVWTLAQFAIYAAHPPLGRRRQRLKTHPRNHRYHPTIPDIFRFIQRRSKHRQALLMAWDLSSPSRCPWIQVQK